MPNSDDGKVTLEFVRRQNADLQRSLERLNSSGGGGTFDGMESRVTRLEQRTDKLSDDVSNIRVDLATLIERVAHLPSKAYIGICLMGMLAAIAALIAFSDQIKALVGS